MMSFMGAIGKIMSGCGLQTMWEQVYVPKSVKHLLDGHAYSRALRAHMLTLAAIISSLLETQSCLSGINTGKLRLLYESLMKDECVLSDILCEHVFTQITQVVGDVKAHSTGSFL